MAKQLTIETETSGTSWRKAICALLITISVMAALVVAVLGGRSAWIRFTERGRDRDAKLKQIGILFKMYANESKGELFPPISPVRGVLSPDMEALEPYLAEAEQRQEIADYLAGKGDAPICYLGFATPFEASAIAVLDEYEAHGPEPLRQHDIQLDEPVKWPGSGEMPIIYQLREGIERFFITEIMAPAANCVAQSQLPALWEIPDPPKRSGGWVLYMDGHVEWEEYPGEFPMTERFIERVKELTASGEPK